MVHVCKQINTTMSRYFIFLNKWYGCRALHIHGFVESRGRVVTRWPGSQEVGGSIPGCATKFVRCKNLAFNVGECVSRGSDTT